MVRFVVGPSVLNTSTLVIDWPNNPYLGICQNAYTASQVAALNSTIQSCGYLVEPPGGNLPAGSRVLLITSDSVSTTANSFTNLTDTLYVIFQCSGNTSGHFANYDAAGGIRKLEMSFGSSCVDSVEYNRGLLTNQSGGVGGTTAQKDGARVDFDFGGNPSYDNDGCQAPVSNLLVDAGVGNNICPSSSVSLQGTISGPYSSFYWSGGAGSFSSTTSLNTIYTSSATESGTINLQLNAISFCGDTVSDVVALTVIQPPTVSISLSSNDTICQGGSVLLSASGATSYNWTGGTTNNSLTVTSSGTYSVVGTNSCGSDTANQNIHVISAPVAGISASGPVTFCQGDDVTLNASGTGIYLWSTGSNAASITVQASGTYSLIVSNSCTSDTAFQQVIVIQPPVANVTGTNSFCQGDSVQLSASGGTSYNWSTGETTQSVYVSSAGAYFVVANDVCGSDTASISITMLSAPNVSISAPSPLTFCQGGSVTLTGNGFIAGSSTWSTGSNNSSITVNSGGQYVFTATNSCGSDSDTVTVNVLALPDAVLNASSSSFCQGGSLNLSATGGNSFLWSNGSTQSSITISSGGNYYVIATNSCGNDTAFTTITMDSLPQVTANNAVVCQGDSVQLSASGANTYLWSTQETSQSIYVSNAGQYFVIGSNSCGNDTAFVAVQLSTINASFTADSLTGTAPLTVNFTNTTVSAVSQVWSFGNSASSTVNSPQHTFNDAGEYWVTLLVTNSDACFDTAMILITVTEDESFLSMPNVFTPNGDGFNDVFKATSLGIETFSCVIFDRWGLQTFAFEGVTGTWDGLQSSGELVDGTYFYIVKAKGFDGKEYDLKGPVLLLR